MKRKVIVIGVVIIALLIGLGITGFNKVSSLLNFNIESRMSYSSSAVLERVQAISELNTVEMIFNEVIDYSDAKYIKKFKIPFTTKKALLSAKASVKAGVKLSEMKAENIKVNKDHVEMVLPKPVITSKEILESNAYNEEDSIFNKMTSEDTLKILEEFTNQMEQQAIESGILIKAEEETKTAVRDLLELMGFNEIDIKFK